VTPEEALDWLYASESIGIKLGLENTNRLLAACGHPERKTRFLHVAGTNGKGSTCAMLASILRRAGYRTGLYTSPHLKNFCERICVDGEMISREDLAAGISRLRDAVHDWDHDPTFFEISTVLALDHFARSGCDLVVLETGMGGRLDSTNAVSPLVSTITPIDMDHMQWLGDTLPKIAAEKAGIIKPGVPVVSAPQQPVAAEVLVHTAAERGSEIRFVSEPCLHPLALAGAHQKWNAALAVETLRASGLGISDAIIREGLLRTEWPARFQRVGERFVVDGAHNAHSSSALSRIKTTPKSSRGSNLSPNDLFLCLWKIPARNRPPRWHPWFSVLGKFTSRSNPPFAPLWIFRNRSSSLDRFFSPARHSGFSIEILL